MHMITSTSSLGPIKIVILIFWLQYNSGNMEFISLQQDLVDFSNSNGSPQSITFTPRSGSTGNGVSHPHFALQYNKEVFIVDLVSTLSSNLTKLNRLLSGLRCDLASLPLFNIFNSPNHHNSIHDNRFNPSTTQIRSTSSKNNKFNNLHVTRRCKHSYSTANSIVDNVFFCADHF